MANPDRSTEADDTESDGVAQPRKRRWPLVLVLLLLLGGGAGGGWFYLGKGEGEAGEAKAAEPQKEPLYYTLAENLVVNFRSPGGTRFLQVGIDLMTYDEKGVEALEKHAPVLRSNLILLLSEQSQDALLSREGKEVLREAATAEARSAMKELAGRPIVESVYFTSFVMQ